MSRVREKIADKQKRAKKITTRLRRMYGAADCALEHNSAWHLLISTILSAQSTDETVNRVTERLYKKYKKPADFLKVSEEELQDDIHATGFFRQKTKSIRGACSMLVEEFGGQVPDNMDDLIRLPGVARKTANVVLGTWFGKNEGVVVDTHVGRIAERLALTWSGKNSKDAVKIEKDLMELIPQKEWTFFSHALIWHGRKICSARKPDCESCKLAELCPSAFSVDGSSPAAKKKAKATRRRVAR